MITEEYQRVKGQEAIQARCADIQLVASTMPIVLKLLLFPLFPLNDFNITLLNLCNRCLLSISTFFVLFLVFSGPV